jgi:hypothetical protein
MGGAATIQGEGAVTLAIPMPAIVGKRLYGTIPEMLAPNCEPSPP